MGNFGAVNRLSKAILIAVGSSAALAVGSLLCVNLYVQSPGSQLRIQEALGKALKLPLVITNTGVSPWGDVQINGISVPTQDGNFLEAANFSGRYKLLPLLSKRLVITDIRVDSPKIVWIQSAEGDWALPALPKSPAPPAPERSDAPNPPKQSASEPRKPGNRFEVTIDGLSVTNASVEFIDKDKKRLALLSGVDIRYNLVTEKVVEGTASIAHASYNDQIAIEGLRSPFRIEEGHLIFSALGGTLAGGPLTGVIEISPKQKRAPFEAMLKFERVDAALLSQEVGWSPGKVSGTLDGFLALKGSSRDIRRGVGEGRLSLVDGQFHSLDLFQTIGQVLQLDELANLKLKSATADFHIGEEKALFDSVLLEGLDLRITGNGYVRFDGKLNMDARLALSPVLAKKLPSFVRESLTETDSGGYPAVAFRVSGKTDRPKTDLAERLVGKKLGDQLENLVSGLFGTHKKREAEEDKDKESKRKKRKKKDETQPEPETVPALGTVPVLPAAAPVPASGAAIEPTPTAPPQ